jgi:threonine/homoserine/homoserine lactone efflux protein
MRTQMKRKGTLFYNFISGFGLTISNPLIVFLFIALFNMLTFVIPSNLFGQAIGYLSIIAGAMLWWFFITYVVSKLRARFDVRGIRVINRIIGAAVMLGSLIGIVLIYTGVWSLH